MKTKHILHLVTFVLTFAVSVTVAGVVKSFQGLSTAEKITNVISQDVQNGVTRRQGCRKTANYLAQKTEGYVSASERLNVSGLPEDFQYAWGKHMQAWRNHANYLNEREFSSDYEASFNENYSRQISEINTTWWEVLRIARKHGAVIPAGAYN